MKKKASVFERWAICKVETLFGKYFSAIASQIRALFLHKRSWFSRDCSITYLNKIQQKGSPRD